MRRISKVILGLLICGLVLLLLAYGLYSSGIQAQNERGAQPTAPRIETKTAKSKTNSQRQSIATGSEAAPEARQINPPGDDFYQPIIENNLFRPLGWRKPSEEPEYALIGTLIESNNQRAKAFLIERRTNRYYPVSVGEKVGDVTVQSIKPNEVSLAKDGKTVTLRADSNRFLDTSSVSSDGGGARSRRDSERASPDSENRGTSVDKSEGHGDRGWGGDRMRQMADRFRNASPEERRRMMREFRQRGGERRLRGEGRRREGGGRGRNRGGDSDTGRRRQ